ncbi:unnamed protein product [Phaeothamnion confervicola]
MGFGNPNQPEASGKARRRIVAAAKNSACDSANAASNGSFISYGDAGSYSGGGHAQGNTRGNGRNGSGHSRQSSGSAWFVPGSKYGGYESGDARPVVSDDTDDDLLLQADHFVQAVDKTVWVVEASTKVVWRVARVAFGGITAVGMTVFATALRSVRLLWYRTYGTTPAAGLIPLSYRRQQC